MTRTTAQHARPGRSTLRLLIIATGLFAALLAPVAVAADDDAAAEPRGFFELSIISSETGEVVAETWLNCAPIGIPDTHPESEAACRQLAAVDGHIPRIPPVQNAICTQEYAPVVVTAKGTWNDAPRAYTDQFSNQCVAVKSTGGFVFAF